MRACVRGRGATQKGNAFIIIILLALQTHTHTHHNNSTNKTFQSRAHTTAVVMVSKITAILLLILVPIALTAATATVGLVSPPPPSPRTGDGPSHYWLDHGGPGSSHRFAMVWESHSFAATGSGQTTENRHVAMYAEANVTVVEVDPETGASYMDFRLHKTVPMYRENKHSSWRVANPHWRQASDPRTRDLTTLLKDRSVRFLQVPYRRARNQTKRWKKLTFPGCPFCGLCFARRSVTVPFPRFSSAEMTHSRLSSCSLATCSSWHFRQAPPAGMHTLPCDPTMSMASMLPTLLWMITLVATPQGAQAGFPDN